MNKTIWLVILAVIIGGGIILYVKNNKQPGARTPAQTTSQKTAETEKMEIKNESETQKEVMAKTGEYKDYSPAALEEAVKNKGKAVIFFHATWCPECKEDNADILANLKNIPAGVTILKADYDTEKELKKKYAVTYQNTFVQTDSTGNSIAKWNNGGQGLSNILKHIK